MSADLDQAAAAARQALGGGQHHAVHYATLGWHALQHGDAAGAEVLFGSALELSPADPESLTGMAQVLRLQRRLREAVLHCDSAISADPAYAHAWLERGFVLATGGSMLAARESYAKAAQLDPHNAAAHAGIASILARDGDSAGGRNHARRALALEPGNAIAAAALATMELESGDAAAARNLAAPLAAALTEPSEDRALLNGLLGDALDKLGDCDAAYTSYARAKADFATIHAPRFIGRASHRDLIERILCELTGLDPAKRAADRSPPSANAARQHLFLLGYPRSGATLVENILASLPDVAALEERPTMVAADIAFLAEPGGLARLHASSDDELTPYRQAYWDSVAQSGVAAAGKCFVDMDPLKGTRLPLIARLFPQAKVLIMRRDPRDVVWSCFHTQFALTNAAMDFTTLERAARHYDALMRLIEMARERLSFSTHEVSYEGLVRDFDTTTRQLCAFAGLPWSDDLHRFDRTARQRGVSTASAGQVRRGLYDGSRQWQRYARHLEPVLPILQPWIERFGYGDDNNG